MRLLPTLGRPARLAAPGRVTLDLDRLVSDGEIAAPLAARLATLATPSRAGATLVGLLYIVGALGLAAGVVLLEPTATTGLLLALAALGGAGLVRGSGRAALDVLVLGLATSGALGLAGWFAVEFGETASMLQVSSFGTAVVLAVALAFRSCFLAALVPLGIGAMLGSGTAYGHAAYYVWVEEPAIAAAAFAVLTATLYAALPRLARLARATWADMARVAARMSLVLANVGLWIGSLWGSHVGVRLWGPVRAEGEDWATFHDRAEAFREAALHVPEAAFTILWLALAVALVPLGRRLGDRFVINAGATFVGLNLYTQLFETLQDDPWSLVIAGAATLAGAVALANRDRLTAKPA